jgi:hypothetical protein
MAEATWMEIEKVREGRKQRLKKVRSLQTAREKRNCGPWIWKEFQSYNSHCCQARLRILITMVQDL